MHVCMGIHVCMGMHGHAYAHAQIAAVPVSLILMFIIFAAIFFAVRYAMCPIKCDSPTVVEVKSAPVSEIATSSRTADELTPGTCVHACACMRVRACVCVHACM